MIHQFIFAGPKPNLPAPAFTSYWINFHARDFAMKIPQIRQYLVAERLHLGGSRELPFHEGVAEIWLKDDAEALASLHTPEFLEGARRDEPRWAAFWMTLGLNTEAQVLKEFGGAQPWPDFVKLYVLVKRRRDLDLEPFRQALVEERRATMAGVQGLERHLIGFSRDGSYKIGEPPFDAVEVLSFRTADALRPLLEGAPVASPLADPRYLFTFVGRENWIIRPGER